MSSHQQPSAPDPEGRRAEVFAEGEGQLRESVAALSRLSTSQTPLPELLTRVATLAVHAIPGADGAGLTLLENDRPDVMVASDEFVTAVDDIQYGLGQGPCITAARDGVTIVSGSLGADLRWQRFGSRVARLGVHSVVSLPLLTPDGVVGAMNVYARGKQVFDDRATRIGEAFAGPAAVAVHNAQVLARAQRLADRLQHALDERAVIDQAVGILISRSGGTAADALQRLRQLSQHEHRKLPEIAATVVEEAGRRARARRAQPD